MKKIVMLVGVVVVFGFVTGCTSTHISQYSAPLELKVQTDKAPVVEVGEEINGQATIQRILFFSWGPSKFADGVNYGGSEAGTGLSLLGDTMGAGKAAAAYNACFTNKADILVVPRYEIEDENYIVYQKTQFKVKGNKGVFKGLK